MYIDLENKTLGQLIELRKILSGTNIYFAVDSVFKSMTENQFNRMINHCNNRDSGRVKKFKLTGYNHR
jgi:hypothetical protein